MEWNGKTWVSIDLSYLFQLFYKSACQYLLKNTILSKTAEMNSILKCLYFKNSSKYLKLASKKLGQICQFVSWVNLIRGDLCTRDHEIVEHSLLSFPSNS